MKERGERANRGGDPATNVVRRDIGDGAVTLSDMGISRDQSWKWQQLAEVPDDEFEAALANPSMMPSTAGIISTTGNNKGERMDDHALWLWGTLCDAEKMGLTNRTLDDLMSKMGGAYAR